MNVVDDGPPVSSERVWATTTRDESIFEVRNVPFFARDVAWGDLVRALPDNNQELEVTGLIRDGGHFTVRVALVDNISFEEVSSTVHQLGASAFQSSYRDLVAIDVPAEEIYNAVLKQLFAWQDAGRIEVEQSKSPLAER